jgi:hypothetical protein
LAFDNLHNHTNSAGQSLNVLINDAKSYHAVLEENRKLFNEIQELKGDYANKDNLIDISISSTISDFEGFYCLTRKHKSLLQDKTFSSWGGSEIYYN